MAASQVASAQPARTLSATLGGSINEPGVEASADAEWKWVLSRSSNRLLSEAHLTLGATVRSSPSYTSLEAWAVLAPLSILEVKGSVEPAYYYGTFAALLPLESYDADFSRDVRNERRDEGQAAFGLTYRVAPSVQFELGRVAVRSTFTYEWWQIDSPASFVYEPRRDTLLEADSDALYRTWSVFLVRLSPRLRVGALHEFTHVSGASANDIQRVGPVFIWESAARWLGLPKPVVFANVYYYLSDRSKEGGIGATIALRVAFGSS